MAKTKRPLVVLFVTALALMAIVGVKTAIAAAVRTVTMMDQCDPDTFNEAFGDGICVGNKGGVKVDTFLAHIAKKGEMGAWHFSPEIVQIRAGEQFNARNKGGETHTFTEVEEFGGGFIPELNGDQEPAPECLDFGTIEFIAPGESTKAETEPRGRHHYQCCIHPWMRADVIVK